MKSYTLPIRFIIVTSACLIAYFLILSLLGLHTNVFDSLFNMIITGFGIYETIKYLKVKSPDTFGYSTGFVSGLVTGWVATLIFALFFAFFSTEVFPGFLEELST